MKSIPAFKSYLSKKNRPLYEKVVDETFYLYPDEKTEGELYRLAFDGSKYTEDEVKEVFKEWAEFSQV